jgi:hypothetical protein
MDDLAAVSAPTETPYTALRCASPLEGMDLSPPREEGLLQLGFLAGRRVGLAQCGVTDTVPPGDKAAGTGERGTALGEPTGTIEVAVEL